MTKLSEEQHFEAVLDHLPYLSSKNLDRLILVAHAFRTIRPHYEPREQNADGTPKDEDADDTE